MASPVRTDDGVVFVNRHEAEDLFDRIARKNLGISGAEFLRRWDGGEFTDLDWDAIEGFAEVAMALPLAR